MRKKILITVIMMYSVALYLLVCGLTANVFFADRENVVMFLQKVEATGVDITTQYGVSSFNEAVEVLSIGIKTLDTGIILYAIGLFIFTCFMIFDIRCDSVALHQKKVKHVFYIIMCFATVLFSTVNYGIYASSLLALLVAVCYGFCITSGILLIVERSQLNKTIMNTNMNYKYVNNNPQPVVNQNANPSISNDVHEAPIENQSVEEKTNLSTEELNEIFSLLAKLEDSHRNGELGDEEYERMKKTILSKVKK